MISDDIRLARELFHLMEADLELEPLTQSLSITTFRFRPKDLGKTSEENDTYLNALNASLLTLLQESGDVYVSNAVVAGKFALRLCVVNFRTTSEDVAALPVVVKRLGHRLDKEMRLDSPTDRS